MEMYGVNWRTGAASIYESEWSLIRKYCYLNRIAFNDIDVGLFSIDESKIRDSLQNKTARTKDRFLSRHLGEPENILRYRQVEYFLLPKQIAGDDQSWISRHLRYCHLCMERGYHSPIHQLPWVIRCPLHGVSLREFCSDCGKKIELKRWLSSWRIRHRGGEDKYCCCDNWPGIRSKEWPSGLRKCDTRPISAYLKWLNSLTSAPEVYLAPAGFRMLRSEQFDASTALELFCFWQTLIPPQPAVKAFLIDPKTQIYDSVSLRIPLADDKSASVISLIKRNGYHAIMESIAKNYIYRHKVGAWDYVLRRIIKIFSGRHRQCPYFKKKGKQKPLISATLLLDEQCADICPRLPFIEALSAKWVILWGVGINLERVLAEYFNPYPNHNIERDLQAIGLLSQETIIPTDISSNAISEMFWTASEWDSMLALFLERLLSYEAFSIASALIETYHAYDENNPLMDLNLCDGEVVPLRHPYVLTLHTPGQGLSLKIWPRHTPIVMPSRMENARDRHKMGIIDYLEWNRKSVRAQKHREIIEGFERYREYWQQCSKKETARDLASQLSTDAKTNTPGD